MCNKSIPVYHILLYIFIIAGGTSSYQLLVIISDHVCVSIDIRVEGLETASRECISGATNRVARDHNGGVDGVSSTAAASSAGK